MNTDKAVALNAWRQVDRRTREAMRRNFLPQLIEGYEVTSKSYFSSLCQFRLLAFTCFYVVYYLFSMQSQFLV